MDRSDDADTVDQDRSDIGKKDTETEPQITASLFFYPVQEREYQHEKGDHHEADAGAGGRHEKIISMAGVSLMRKVFKGNAAKDADPPHGGGQHPVNDITVSYFGEVSQYENGNDCQQVKRPVFLKGCFFHEHLFSFLCFFDSAGRNMISTSAVKRRISPGSEPMR